MPLKLFDSLSQKKEEFKPLNKDRVLMYVCGITPYDTTHLGHAFTYIHFDVLQRYLKFLGYKVNYTQNVTDIDDDILKKAKEEEKDWQELGIFWTNRFLDDLKFLNIEIPNNYVKATDSIPTIIKIIERLIKSGFAYEINGNVYFEVSKFKNYSKLSKLSRREMILISKERGADPDDPSKKNPLDFILWQKSRLGEPYWDSPFGKGRPGWHIECSAMILDFLGEQIDIHGGGEDLIFPHHESEIAQSESYSGKSPFVRYWMHVGMLEYQGEKMSKSLGNLVLVSDLAKKYSGNAIRWLLLSHHYRDAWEFKYSQMAQAQKIVDRIEKTLSKQQKFPDINKIKKFIEDDLDTPRVLKFMESIASDKNKATNLFVLFKLLGFKING